MKKFSVKTKILLSVLLFHLSINSGVGQTFNCYITNDHLTSTTVFEFDVCIQNTSGSDFKLRTVQHCITFNSVFINGAVITASYVASSTQMNSYIPGTATWSPAGNGFEVGANTGINCGNGTIIPASGLPVRVATFRLTANSGSFGCAPVNPNMALTGDPVIPSLPLKMGLTIWTDPTCVSSSTLTLTNGIYTRLSGQTLYSFLNNMKPEIVTQPSDITITSGGSAIFTTSVNAISFFSNAVTYQWLENGNIISDGFTVNGTYAGSQTPTLTITNALIPLQGNLYSVIVSQCNSDTSSTATLFINPVGVTEIDNTCSDIDISPNPVTMSSVISFTLCKKDDATVHIFDISGREIKTFFNPIPDRGIYSLVWDVTDNDGSLVDSGVYLLAVSTTDGTKTKMIRVVK